MAKLDLQIIHNPKHMRPVIFLLCIFPFLLPAQNYDLPPAGAKGAAMGNTGLTFTDIHSGISNQAGLAYLKAPAVSVGAHQKFLINDLQLFTLMAAYPTQSGTFGLQVNYFGFDLYNEQKIGIAYSRRLFDNLSIGAQIDFLNTRIEEFGSKGLFTFELGLQAKVLEDLYIGAHIYNPIRQEIVEDEFLPTIFSLGLGYIPSEKVEVLIEVQKNIDFPVSFRFGLQYTPIQELMLRTGFQTESTQFSMGAGYVIKKLLVIDIAANYHQILGFTPSVGLTYQIQKKST